MQRQVPKMDCFVLPSYFGSCDASSEAYDLALCCEIAANFDSQNCADLPEVQNMVASRAGSASSSTRAEGAHSSMRVEEQPRPDVFPTGRKPLPVLGPARLARRVPQTVTV